MRSLIKIKATPQNPYKVIRLFDQNSTSDADQGKLKGSIRSQAISVDEKYAVIHCVLYADDV